MTILIDIVHASNVFFYKNTIKKLQKHFNVIITVRQRNRLDEFACETLGIPVTVTGTHQKTLLGKITGFGRIIKLHQCLKRNHVSLVTGFSNYYISIAARLAGIPSLLFTDNYEYRFEFEACRMFADRLVVPACLNIDRPEVVKFNGYKELAYLNNFIPSLEIIRKFGISHRKYIIIRLVAAINLDYTDMLKTSQIDNLVKFLESNTIPLLASIEPGAYCPESLKRYAQMIGMTPHLHSLMYYSYCVISTGDTVAREAVFMGVPSIYIGKRTMRINQELLDLKLMYQPSEDTFITCLKNILKSAQTEICNERWDDTTDVIVKHILDFAKMLGYYKLVNQM